MTNALLTVSVVCLGVAVMILCFKVVPLLHKRIKALEDRNGK